MRSRIVKWLRRPPSSFGPRKLFWIGSYEDWHFDTLLLSFTWTVRGGLCKVQLGRWPLRVAWFWRRGRAWK